MKGFTIIRLAVISFAFLGLQSSKEKTDGRKPSPNDVVFNTLNSKDPFRERGIVDFDAAFLKKKDQFSIYLIKSFKNDFDGVNPNNILSVSLFESKNIIGLGLCDIYKIKLSDNLPEIIGKKAYLIFIKSEMKAALLWLDDLECIKIKNYDTAYYLAGINRYRGKGYFLVYKFSNDNNGVFKLIFDSSDDMFCGNGIPILNNSFDCISYDPAQLHFKNIDLNNDGLNDLMFIGRVLYFCEGLETGYGRNDRKPLRKETLNIVFQTFQDHDSIYWRLMDTTICKKLQ